ncbi:MAG: dTDP-glucose 4,6-dehydratase [Acidimicrobiales bacterium]|nr:dTDP-glucose 4,6-dehydratase [Acidimicrobiales bacterium]
MRVLVTGAAGFIGSNYVRYLLANTDDKVTIIDLLTYAGGIDTIADLVEEPRVTFVKGDIGDRLLLTEIMGGHEAVVNFAAESHVDRSIVDPDAFVRTNCLGTNVLCDVARLAGVERVVHVSTDEVYGSTAQGSFVEDDALSPSSPYSASKAGSDLIALSHHKTFGLDISVTRASNTYGPFQFPEKIIPLFVTNLLSGQQLPLYGDGSNIRDWLHVVDHCAAIDLVLRHGEAGQIYNVGGDCELTNLDLTQLILELCGADERSIRRVEDRPGHDLRYSVDSSKVRELGWVPTIDIRSGLASTVEWYRSNAWWWQPRRG